MHSLYMPCPALSQAAADAAAAAAAGENGSAGDANGEEGATAAPPPPPELPEEEIMTNPVAEVGTCFWRCLSCPVRMKTCSINLLKIEYQPGDRGGFEV
jgi:hypothetical protein